MSFKLHAELIERIEVPVSHYRTLDIVAKKAVRTHLGDMHQFMRERCAQIWTVGAQRHGCTTRRTTHGQSCSRSDEVRAGIQWTGFAGDGDMRDAVMIGRNFNLSLDQGVRN